MKSALTTRLQILWTLLYIPFVQHHLVGFKWRHRLHSKAFKMTCKCQLCKWRLRDCRTEEIYLIILPREPPTSQLINKLYRKRSLSSFNALVIFTDPVLTPVVHPQTGHGQWLVVFGHWYVSVGFPNFFEQQHDISHEKSLTATDKHDVTKIYVIKHNYHSLTSCLVEHNTMIHAGIQEREWSTLTALLPPNGACVYLFCP